MAYIFVPGSKVERDRWGIFAALSNTAQSSDNDMYQVAIQDGVAGCPHVTCTEDVNERDGSKMPRGVVYESA
jgi:hypothetical protein